MGKKKVVLLQGGLGAEREVSLSTGQGFQQALRELGYPFHSIDCREDFLEQITDCRKNFKPDVALLALHGKYAEDGIVQGICEYIKLPYSGSGVLASALCMDKIFTKQLLSNNHLVTPEYQTVEKNNIESFELKLTLPVVVKPSREGSSVGVSIVKNKNDLLSALKLAAQYDVYLVIEKFVSGMELTVPILNGRALAPIEIVPKVDFYDYKNKYTSGRTEYIMPARLAASVLQSTIAYAEQAFRVCRLRCYGRIDFRISETGIPFIIEINTLPGCTPTSLLPKSAKHSGIDFNKLVETLVENASLDYLGVK